MFSLVLSLITSAHAACTVTLTSPAVGTNATSAPTFRWSSSGDCRRYRVQLATLSTFVGATSLPYVTTRTQTMTDDTFDTLATTAGRSLFWRVQSVDMTSVTANTAGRRITLRQGDADDDGYLSTTISGGTDCDDTNAAINPGATEVCNLVDDDCDATIDEDQGACYDTGLQVAWYAGEAEVSADGATFNGGRFGYDITAFHTLPELSSVCENMGTWTNTGAAVDCPFCDWAFNLEVADTTASGPWCDDYGLGAGTWDGFTADWGFIEATSYTYGAITYDYSDMVLYGYAGYWYLFSYNLAFTYGGIDYSYGYNTGDAESMTFHQPFGIYSYYYP